jgi:heterodisulfide reductase subunit B
VKVSYYPGCSLHGTAKEYDLSVRSVSRALGIELEEIEDWSCCGATSAHSTNFKLSVALPARDLISAEKKPLDVMIPCAACFNRFKTAEHHLQRDPALKAEIEEIVGGRYQGSVAIRNPIDILARDIGLEALAAKVVKKLTGLRPVSYYGCLLLRPPDICQFDNAENPVLLDQILQDRLLRGKSHNQQNRDCGRDGRSADGDGARGGRKLLGDGLPGLYGKPGYARLD